MELSESHSSKFQINVVALTWGNIFLVPGDRIPQNLGVFKM